MIAVSQNLVLGALAAPLRAAAGITTVTTVEGNAFLQAFVTGDDVGGMAEASNADPDLKREVTANEPEAPDVEVRAELTPVDGAMWLPVAQVITTPPLPNTGKADTGKTDTGKADTGKADLSAETETGVNSSQATIGTAELETTAPMPPNPMGETLGQPLADPTFDRGEGVTLQQNPTNERMAATVLRSNVEASKPNTEFAPASQSKDAYEPPKQLPSAPPKSVAADGGRATEPHAGLTQTYMLPMVEGQFSPAADQSNTPAEHLILTYVDTEIVLSASDLPARKAWPDPRVSNVENAWREKWASDVPVPFDNDAQANAQTFRPAINDIATPKVVFAASAVIVSLATQKTPNPAAGHTPMPGTILESPPADKSPKSSVPDIKTPNEPLPSAIRHDRGIQLADKLLETVTSFDVGSFATSAASAPQPAVSSFAPLLRSLAPSLPKAVSPTIVEMAKSGNDGPLELALSPEELGRLTISIKQDGDFVYVTVTADRPETLDLMRRHGSDLVTDLRQAGFSGASLSFGQGGQGQQPRFANAEPAAKNLPIAQHLPPETKPTASSRSQKGSGVDLRF